MKFASIAMLVVLVGCASMATPPQNGCGMRFTSWCISRQVSPELLPEVVANQRRVSIKIDGKSAVLIFSQTCSTGTFRGFTLVKKVPDSSNQTPTEVKLAWSPEGDGCSIQLDNGNLNESQYNDLARSVHYYLIEIGAEGTLKTFPF